MTDLETRWQARVAETAGKTLFGQVELFEAPGQGDLFSAPDTDTDDTEAVS